LELQSNSVISEIISGKLDLKEARLVTLSACETGVTDVSQSPDEYVGMPAGFLQAGAPAVVSSLWTVDDESTLLRMERFYHNHLERNMDLAAALRDAQLWLRDEKGYASPFYWAAFTFTGA
jgi:CHAT domain-containing protein